MSASESEDSAIAPAADVDPQARPAKTPLVPTTAVFAVAFLAMLDMSISNLALPSIREDLHTSLSGLQWIFDAYALCFAGLILIGGLICDRVGQRTCLLLSTTLFIVGSAVCAAASTSAMLITGRAVQGTGTALLVPACMALIASLYPDDKSRARVLGYWSALNGVSIAVGPAIGGVLVDVLGWRSIFGVNIPLGLLALGFAAGSLPKAAVVRGVKLDLAGVVLGIAWAFSLAFAVIEGGTKGWGSPVIIGAFVIAALALTAFLIVESRISNAMLPLQLFRSHGFATATVIAFAIGFSLSTSFYFLSLHLQQVMGYSSLKAGFGFLPSALALTVASTVAGRLTARYGARLVMVAGVLLGSVGLFSMGTVDADTGFPMIVWMLILIGAGLGVVLPPNNHTALNSVPESRVGAASGTVNTLMQFGTVCGVAVLGVLQATAFRGDLRDRLIESGVAPNTANDVAEAVVDGRTEAITGVSGRLLADLVPQSFAQGLHLSWVTAGAVAVIVPLVVLVVFRTKRGTTEDGPDDDCVNVPAEGLR